MDGREWSEGQDKSDDGVYDSRGGQDTRHGGRGC